MKRNGRECLLIKVALGGTAFVVIERFARLNTIVLIDTVTGVQRELQESAEGPSGDTRGLFTDPPMRRIPWQMEARGLPDARLLPPGRDVTRNVPKDGTGGSATAIGSIFTVGESQRRAA